MVPPSHRTHPSGKSAVSSAPEVLEIHDNIVPTGNSFRLLTKQYFFLQKFNLTDVLDDY